MNGLHATHPSLDQLAAFRLGKISLPELSDIERHVSECDACCHTMRTLPDDTFIGLVRGCDPSAPFRSDTDVPDHSRHETPTCTHLSGVLAEFPELPPELVRHQRYRVLELVGAGGMGAVYKAEHQLMQRRVALKVIRRELMNKPAAVERFRREVRAAARLTHPNIVTAHDAEQAGDTHFLVMEYVDGISLSNLVKQKGPLPVSQACEFVRQTALGLQHAYERGMVHRDIKPQNLMLTPGNQIKILDFGLASYLLEEATTDGFSSDGSHDPVPGSLTQTGSLMGTPDYVAPEQIEDARRADTRADIYGLGCTLYYLLTGNVPFPGDTLPEKLKAHQTQPPPPLDQVRPDIPAGLSAAVARMMAKNPAERYQTPAEVAEALVLYVTESEPAIVVGSPPPPPDQPSEHGVSGSLHDKRPRPQRWSWAALLVVGLGITALAVMAHQKWDQGKLVLDLHGEDLSVELVVKKGNKEVLRQQCAVEPDTEHGRDTFALPSGKYDVEVLCTDTEAKLITETIVVDRGKETIIKVNEPLQLAVRRAMKATKHMEAALKHQHYTERDMSRLLANLDKTLREKIPVPGVNLFVPKMLVLRKPGAVAVLPFISKRNDPELDDLRDNIPALITVHLTHRPPFQPRPYSSMSQYRGPKRDLKAIAQELGVQLVVTGSFFKHKKDLLVNVELVDPASEDAVAAQEFRWPLEKVPDLRTELPEELTDWIDSELEKERTPRHKSE